MIGETISHYKVLSRLGAGGMGVVYEAEDTRLGRKVAIKLLPEEANADSEAVQRFLREARVISSLNHPHICTLYDIGEHPSTRDESGQARPDARSGQASQRFMVMELLDGQSLKERIAKGALPPDEVLELAAQMADALDAAHAQGIVHRDIKPANLFITRRGSMKVLDFGVAKLNKTRDHLDSTMGATDQLTTLGTTIGTVSYMSPEQARGQEIDARSDVFSAGVVLYEMATGHLPFPGTTVATIFEGLLTKKPLPASQLRAGLTPEFDHIIDKALEKDRETRYQGAAELRADLKRLRRATESGATAVAAAPADVASGFSRTVPAPSPKRVAAAVPAAVPKPVWRKPLVVGAPLLMGALVGGVLLYRSITTPALTEKDTVVLSSVVNRTGDTMFDDTLGEALALQLRQSPFLTVAAEQQVQSTLRLMGRNPSEPITAEVGREVCQRAGGKALLGGTIAMLGSAYVITLNAQDCLTGGVLAEEQVQASSKETVLASLGSAVSVFREKLGESLASIQRYDAKIEEATTPSLEALKAYSQGLKTRRTTGDFDSVPFFLRAVELDPEFGLAYARLGTVYSNLGQQSEARKMTAKAYDFRAKVSEVERYYIEARFYSTVEPDPRKALDVYRVWLGAYPNDYTALANSALLLKQLGEPEQALTNQEAATRVAPEQPVAWSNLGDTYMGLGRFPEARKALETAVQIQNAVGPRASLYALGVITGDLALADQQVEAIAGRRDEVDFLRVRIQAALFHGKFQEASNLAAEWKTRMDAASRRAQTGEVLMSVAVEKALVGMTAAAKAGAAAVAEEERLNESTIDDQIVLAALTHDASQARVMLPKVLAAFTPPGGVPDAANEIVRTIRSLAAVAEGRPAEAISLLEPITFTPDNANSVTIWSIAQLELKDWESAVKGLTYLTEDTWQRSLGASKGFALASLARASVELGNRAEARRWYEALFEFWKDADQDIPILVQAHEEFAKLGS